MARFHDFIQRGGYQIAFESNGKANVAYTDLAGNLLKTNDFGPLPLDFVATTGPEKAVFKALKSAPDSLGTSWTSKLPTG